MRLGSLIGVRPTFGAFAIGAIALAGCQIQSGPGPVGPTPPPPAQPVEASSSGAPAPSAGTAECPNPENHCLEDGIYLIAERDLSGAWTYVEPATPSGPVDAGGEATFFNLHTTKDQSTKWHYATRPASANDIMVGQTVFMVHRRDGDTYRPPQSRQEATSSRWWMAKIASVAPTAANGYVIVTGGYQVAVQALRVSDAVAPAGVAADMVSGEDAHFVTPNHYLIADRALSGKWMYAELAAPIQEPSAATKGDGQFLALRDGKISWTKHNWRTRPATNSDLKVGAQVFMVHVKEGDSYRAPKDRLETLNHRWWTAKVTDVSQLYKGMVTVGGGYLVNVSALRVAN